MSPARNSSCRHSRLDAAAAHRARDQSHPRNRSGTVLGIVPARPRLRVARPRRRLRPRGGGDREGRRAAPERARASGRARPQPRAWVRRSRHRRKRLRPHPDAAPPAASSMPLARAVRAWRRRRSREEALRSRREANCARRRPGRAKPRAPAGLAPECAIATQAPRRFPRRSRCAVSPQQTTGPGVVGQSARRSAGTRPAVKSPS